MSRTFSDTVNALRYGTLAEELTKQLADLTAKCSDTGRTGSITLTLQLKPGKGGQIEVFDDIKVKAPKEERGSSIMYATPEGSLQREDPKQTTLDLREVMSTAPATLRNVDRETGEIRSISAA